MSFEHDGFFPLPYRPLLVGKYYGIHRKKCKITRNKCMPCTIETIVTQLSKHFF